MSLSMHRRFHDAARNWILSSAYPVRIAARTTFIKFRFHNKIWRPEPWVHPASPAYSRSQTLPKGHFPRRQRPCRHSDERAARGLPDYSRRDLAAFEFDNAPKNKLRAIESFCWTRTRYLTHSRPNQEKLQEKYAL